MHPGERVEAIKRIAESLAAKDWEEIDLILDQFGFVTYERWAGDKVSYVRECVQHGGSDELAALDAYLTGVARRPEGSWDGDGFRLFLTHIATKRDVAFALKRDLEYFGIDAFVAHADIEPLAEWRATMEAALYSCDALAGLLHEGFRESDWCDQEVGVAMGRGVPVVPLQYDFPPYGFFGSVQALNASSRQGAEALARNIVRVLLKEDATAARLTAAIVHRLARADTFGQANELSKILATDATLVSEEQVRLLREAQRENRQLREAFHFERHLASIEAKFPRSGRLETSSSLTEVEPF